MTLKYFTSRADAKNICSHFYSFMKILFEIKKKAKNARLCIFNDNINLVRFKTFGVIPSVVLQNSFIIETKRK